MTTKPNATAMAPGFKFTMAMQSAARRTGSEEFNRLRLAVRKLDVEVGELRLREANLPPQSLRKDVVHRLTRACELRAQAMGQLARLGALMNAG